MRDQMLPIPPAARDLQRGKSTGLCASVTALSRPCRLSSRPAMTRRSVSVSTHWTRCFNDLNGCQRVFTLGDRPVAIEIIHQC